MGLKRFMVVFVDPMVESRDDVNRPLTVDTIIPTIKPPKIYPPPARLLILSTKSCEIRDSD